MGVLQSRQDDDLDTDTDTATDLVSSAPSSIPAQAITPPHPSASDNAPPRSFLSYFLPVSTPTLSYQKLRYTPASIDAVSTVLRTKVPAELIPRILDYAECYTGSRVMSTKEVCVVAGLTIIRGTATNEWCNGQEGELAVSQLDDLPGESWVLASEVIGTSEQRDGEQGNGHQADSGHPAQHEVALPEEPDSRTSWEYVREDEVDEASTSQSITENREADTGDRKGVWLREIVIETLSKDQGWSSYAASYGTYDSSYSWFEVSLLRDGAEVADSRQTIQYNVHAGQYFKAHRIVLDSNHALVKQAREGDRVILWARAQYPGWRNYVREVAITIYTSPYPPYSF